MHSFIHFWGFAITALDIRSQERAKRTAKVKEVTKSYTVADAQNAMNVFAKSWGIGGQYVTPKIEVMSVCPTGGSLYKRLFNI